MLAEIAELSARSQRLYGGRISINRVRGDGQRLWLDGYRVPYCVSIVVGLVLQVE